MKGLIYVKKVLMLGLVLMLGVSLFACKTDELTQENSELKQQLEQKEAEISALQTQVSSLQAQITTLELAKTNLQNQIVAFQEINQNQAALITTLQQGALDDASTIEALNLLNAQQVTIIATLQEAKLQLEGQITALEEAQAAAVAQNLILQEELAAVNGDKNALSEQLQAIQADLAGINNDLLAANNSLLGANELIESLNLLLANIQNQLDALTFEVSFDSLGGSLVPSQKIAKDGKGIVEPANPTKEGYFFAGWFTDSVEQGTMWDFAHYIFLGDTTLYAKWLVLNASHVYIDTYLTNPGQYQYNSLATLRAGISAGTTVYFAPGVYWTDDYLDPNNANTTAHPGLTGMTFSQQNLSFIGLTNNPNEVIIAGNRGQTLGSVGNWNVIGVSAGLTLKNLTVGNYCNVDLVFPRDPSKNVAKRAGNYVQAQTLNGSGDKYVFENVRFVSFLNLMASFSPTRAYYKNCFLQSTDDAIAGGQTNVFENCEFHFYGGHPSAGGSSVIVNYLGCTFYRHGDAKLYFSKSGGTWAVIDCNAVGDFTSFEWENTLRPNQRNYVSNFTLNGEPSSISDSQPQITVNLNEVALLAWKVNGVYNIWNLLRNADNWDPAGQSTLMADYGSLLYKVSASASPISELSSESHTAITVTAAVGAPARVTLASQTITFSYDEELFDLDTQTATTIKLITKTNNTGVRIKTVITAQYSGGLTSGYSATIAPVSVSSPLFDVNPTIVLSPNNAQLAYVFDHPEYTDTSTIRWYRSASPDGSSPVLVGQNNASIVAKNYGLTLGDIGFYIVARITPKYEFSTAAPTYLEVITDFPIDISDVPSTDVNTNFSTFVPLRTSTITNYNWFMDCRKSADSSGLSGTASASAAGWEYKLGTINGETDRYGLSCTTQFARLFFAQTAPSTDQTFTLVIAPSKTAGQGFGSAPQYMDIYIKYDIATRNGYGLRILRTTGTDWAGSAVIFSLIEINNDVATQLTTPIPSSVFITDVTITVSLTGSILRAIATTNQEQSEANFGFGITHSIDINFDIAERTTNKTYSSCGLYYASTVGGNTIMLENWFTHTEFI
ncbi:MAG: InlB B-repeat-containing protein [Acholeplasmatales bacterium]|jgi:uncharacterized repeat protein (TIGR02543 family)|nr:InlB B-repeat-containing protein [Acholeplasmatales bacterium]